MTYIISTHNSGGDKDTFDKVGEGLGITKIRLETEGEVPGMDAAAANQVADLILGRINPQRFLNGGMPLDNEIPLTRLENPSEPRAGARSSATPMPRIFQTSSANRMPSSFEI